jgi:hypothetical protein
MDTDLVDEPAPISCYLVATIYLTNCFVDFLIIIVVGNAERLFVLISFFT